MKTLALIALVGYAVSTSALTIKFKQVHIQYVDSISRAAVWPAVGKASNGQPDPSIKFSKKLDPSQSASFGVDDHTLGIRVWGRTGCDANSANCKTGACNGGLVCNNAGITSPWDLSRIDASINIDTQLSSSDGQTVVCRASNCPANQAYNSPIDYAADRNSPLGQTFTHTFCP
ncbi:Osmotin thaumatin-like protein [Ganoderma leucocontextum]|nr:Osmotin thaumatin-like protein [Ganoderma leucocontextum]